MKLVPCFLLFVVCACVDSRSIRRARSPFKSSVADRIAHGFGKRQDTTQDIYQPSHHTRNVMTTYRLAKLLMGNNLLANTIVEKFVDANGDGIVDTKELLRARLGTP